MKQKNQRALNAFAAMESLPDDLILDAERALTEAENGFSLTPSGRENPFVRFLNSGWGVAAIAGLVSVVVLVILIRAGKEPAPYQPPVKPAGSTIEMSSEGADYTLSMEQGSYDEGADRITVIMTGKTPGEAISMRNGWHLERLTEEGAEIVHIYYTEEAIEAFRPDKDGYATIKKTIHIDRTPLTAGTYRLHATRHDGEKYVSVAWCEFTVGESTASSFELSFPGFRISLPEDAYLYDKPNDLVINRGIEDPGSPEHITDESLPTTRTLTVDGKEYTLTYWYTQSRNSPTDTDYYTYTQPGHADGEWSILAIYPHGSDQLAEVNYRCRDGFLLNGLPTTQAEAQTVADARVKELMGSLPRSSNYRYDADSNRHTVTYHSTSPLINTAGASIYKLSNADIVQIRVSLSRFDEAQIHADIGNLNISLLTASLEDFLTRYYKDSSITFEGLEEGVSATQGPCIHYTATITAEGRRQSISVQVYRSGPQTDDPDKTVERGVFFWANGSPFINLSWGGEVYPVSFSVETDTVDFSGLTTGDTVEIVMGEFVEETFPAHGYLYDIRKLSDGTPSDLPAAMVEAMEDMGYKITEAKESE